MRRAIAILLSLALAEPAVAKAPEVSPRPMARDTTIGAVEPILSTQSIALVRPVLRPAAEPAPMGAPELSAETVEMVAAVISRQSVARSLRPTVRPNSMVERAMAKRRALTRGQVCGETAIQGEPVGYVPGRIKGCGIKNAVKVKSVAGVTLSQPATIDCTTAKALRRWVDRGAKPAVGTRGGGLKQLHIAAHYACRTRNNRPGAKISEHGRGRAVDISGFRLADGSKITVFEGWNRKGDGAILRKMHKTACGPFGTVLGPNSDRFHRDHFHFDTARYRSGSYCR